MNRRLKNLFAVFGVVCLMLSADFGNAQDFFKQGSQAYLARHYDEAAKSFGQLIAVSPSTGAFHNLGDAEWQNGHTGTAILAWERAAWVSPFNAGARENLRFARKARLLDSPELAWYEVCSMWLPVNAWPWIACLTFWLAVAMVICPGIFQWRRRAWHQAFAAGLFAVFLLTLPALAGVQTRSKLGIVTMRESPLRLTPTVEGESLTRLVEGEMVRCLRERGRFVYVHTANANGWLDRDQFGLISQF